MKLNEIFNKSSAPASFEELLVSMKRSFGVDFGLKRPPINISSLHSDPKMAKALADKMESKLRTAITNNNITLNISYDDKTAVLNLVYNAAEKTVHCKLDNDYSFDIEIGNGDYGPFNMVSSLKDKCIKWFDKQDNK